MGKLMLNGRNYSGLVDAQGIFIDTENVITSGTWSNSYTYTATQDCVVVIGLASISSGIATITVDGETVQGIYSTSGSAVQETYCISLKKEQVLVATSGYAAWTARYTVYGIQMGSQVTFLSEYASACYDTDEREVGCWVDGKSLYQRTFDIGSTTISYNNWTVSSIPKGDMETITHASAVNQNGKAFWGDVMTSLEVDNTYVALQCGRNGANEIMRYVTLRYTKTTDVAGSGSWTPMATPTHHYSTDEKVVGTWVDGKPIYETLFPITSTVTFTSNSWVDMGINQGDMYKIIDGKVIMDYQGAYSFQNLQFGWINNKLVGNSFRNFEVEANHGYVVLQYTKSTD